jgi:DNA repair protein RadC
MSETPSLGDISQELLEAYSRGSPEDRKRLRTLLAMLQGILSQSRVSFDEVLPDSLPDRDDPLLPSSDEDRQLSFDFVSPSGRPLKTGDHLEDNRAEYRSSLMAMAVNRLPLYELCDLTRSRLEQHFHRADVISTPDIVKNYLIARLAPQEREIFASIFLDNRHRVIAYEELFFGTVNGCSVHPREVVRRAIFHNAAAMILAHNHPSGVPEASRADENITKRLKDALALIDVRILDHILVGGGEAVSFAEKGLM